METAKSAMRWEITSGEDTLRFVIKTAICSVHYRVHAGEYGDLLDLCESIELGHYWEAQLSFI